jgi:RNA polymerase sigma factor (sigma-70 family)
MPFTNEALLSEALHSGNRTRIEAAFETIYNDEVKLVAFVVAKYIADPETVKDITNDVFLRFFQNAAVVTGSIKFYLCQSAKNAAINEAKKERPLADTELSEEFPSNDDERGAAFYRELVASLNAVLTPKELEIVLLHAVEGYPFKEIGAKLGLSENAANVAYFRAIKKYRRSRKEEKV